MIARIVKLLVALLLAGCMQASKVEMHHMIVVDPASNVPTYSQDGFERFVGQFPGPYFFSATVGDARSGKSKTSNLRVRIRNGGQVPEEAVFRVCDDLQACTKGIDVVAIPRADGSGTDLTFDVEGGSLAENAADMSVLLTIGACISSGPLVLMNAVLDDKTVHLVGRVAAHLLDQSSGTQGATCSFREGGPDLVVVVNKNDGAVRQEASPGGLQSVWDNLTAARAEDATVINRVFKSVRLYALPYEKDAAHLSSLDSEFGQKVRALDQLLMAEARPVTLVSESNTAVCYEGTPATIAAAVGDIFAQARILSKDGYYTAPRVRDFVTRDANSAVASCRDAFHSAAAHWAKPGCEDRCSEGGCQAVYDWLAPARDTAERCFAEATKKWREGGNPFGASVLDPALKQLNDDTQHRANELHNAWQYANSVDADRTKHESQTREVRRWGPEPCSGRYGGKCGKFHGKPKYQDFCTYAKYGVDNRSCTFKRCEALIGCTGWTEASTYEKEIAKETRNVC